MPTCVNIESFRSGRRSGCCPSMVTSFLKGAKILVLGIAYKANVDDMRESPSLKVIELLREKGANVLYNDPHCPSMHKMRHYDLGMRSVELTPELLASQDAVVTIQ